MRKRLPNRRPAEIVEFEHDGRRWTATFSRSASGDIDEVFLDGPPSPLTDLAREAAILASLALQFGAPPETLVHAIRSMAASPLAGALACAYGERRRA